MLREKIILSKKRGEIRRLDGTFLAHLHGRAILDQGNSFFAYILFIIEFKGIVMKLKNVPHTIP